MNSDNNKIKASLDIVDVIQVVIFIVAIILIHTVCAPCKTGMICKRTTQLISVGMVFAMTLTIVVSVFKLFINQKAVLITDIITRIVFILFCILLYAMPVLFGSCKKPDMICNLRTFPCVRVTAAAISALNSLRLVRSISKFCKEKKECP